MIEHKGDITQVTEGIVVHGCNAQGVMGSGVAKAIRSRWPGAYEAYREHYELYGLEIGDIVPYFVNNKLLIVNAVTQRYYGRDGKKYLSYAALGRCFNQIEQYYYGFGDLHFPMIGAGLAGGEWKYILPIINAQTRINKHLWTL